MMRSHYCGQLNESLADQEVTLCGWVHRRRDHGGVIFLDIRDREGLAQVVFDPDRAETFAKADRVRSEYVVKVTGKVRLRPEGARNANMAAGAIEVLGYELEVLNEAETPPYVGSRRTEINGRPARRCASTATRADGPSASICARYLLCMSETACRYGSNPISSGP